MGYTKQNFTDGQILTADNLNNIENGIVNLEDDLQLTAPQIYNQTPQKKASGEQIKILCFGSSWFLNTWFYLNKITNNLGIHNLMNG